MEETILWLRELIVNYPNFQYIFIFFGSALGGDFMLIALGFLAAQGILSPMALVSFSFLGTFCSDIMLFLVARTTFFHNIISHRYTHKTVSLVVESLRRISRGNHFLALVIAKFLVGTRVLIVLYSDRTDLSFKKFAPYDALAAIIWLITLIPIGVLLGLGFTYFAQVLKNIYAGVGLILLFILVAFIVEMWLKNVFTRTRENNS